MWRNAARPGGALAYLCLRLGHDRLNTEVIKASLDALAGIRPLLLGHMRPASHISLQSATALSCRFCAGVERRPLRLFRWGGPRLRADAGSEMLGCRLAILRRRLMQTNLQRWSEQEMVQFLDWSRSQGRGVAWDGSRTPENAQRRQCNKPDGGALKGGRHEYGEQISCHPKASAHAVTVLPRFGKYLSVSIGGGESYETQSQRSYILDIA